MTEAKARNPHIETYGLAESWPRWVHGPNASTSVGPLDDPQLSAQYITEWVKGAKDVHNLTIDWVGMWNEHWEAPAVMYAYTTQLRAQLDAAGLQATRIIGPDAFSGASETLAQKIIQDPSGIGAAVDAIGVHGGPVADPSNPNGSATWRSGKKLYASEDGSTYGDVPGALCPLSLSLSLSLSLFVSVSLQLSVFRCAAARLRRAYGAHSIAFSRQQLLEPILGLLSRATVCTPLSDGRASSLERTLPREDANLGSGAHEPAHRDRYGLS
jgi:hypothetical protein